MINHLQNSKIDILIFYIMFFKNKIVIADGIKDKYLSIIEEIVLKAPEQGVLIIREGNLSKSSKIRKLFE